MLSSAGSACSGFGPGEKQRPGQENVSDTMGKYVLKAGKGALASWIRSNNGWNDARTESGFFSEFPVPRTADGAPNMVRRDRAAFRSYPEDLERSSHPEPRE